MIKDVVGYEGLYTVSLDGRVYNNRRKMYMSCFITSRGYVGVNLTKNKVKKYQALHQIIAKAFIPNPDNKSFINHKNGIKTDNKIENLEWCTYHENNLHAHRTGLWKQKKDTRGEKSNTAKLTESDVLEIRRRHISRKRNGRKKLAEEFGVSVYTITDIMNRSTWSHI